MKLMNNREIERERERQSSKISYAELYHLEYLRAGLRVGPESNFERPKEAHFTTQAQCFSTLVQGICMIWIANLVGANPLLTWCVSPLLTVFLCFSGLVSCSMGPFFHRCIP